MARALIIGPKEFNEIRAAHERARANPIPWETLQVTIPPEQNTGTLTLDNRAKGLPKDFRPPSQQVLIPVGYRMAISYERQPAGLLAHFSFSVEGGKPGALPDPAAVELLLEALDFDFRKADSIWREEFLVNGKPGGLAVNMLFMVEPDTSVMGHA